MSTSILDSLVLELQRLLQPVVTGAENPQLLQKFLAGVGAVNSAPAALVDVLSSSAEFARQLQALYENADVSFEALSGALQAARGVFDKLERLSDAGEVADQLQSLGTDLIDALLSAWLFRYHPRIAHLGSLLTLIKPDHEQPLTPAKVVGEQLIRAPFRIDRFRLQRLVDLLRDPVATLRSEYLNALATQDDADAVADKLFQRLEPLLRHLGISCRYGVNPDDLPLLGDAARSMAHSLIIYLGDLLAGAQAEAGIVLNIDPDLGLVAAPFGALNFTRQAGVWTFIARATTGIDGVAWGRAGVTLSSQGNFSGGITVRLDPPDGESGYVLGAASGTHLRLGGLQFSIDTTLSAQTATLALAADVSKSSLVIAGGDGFLSSILPAEGLRTDFDLGLAWSNDKGFTLRGSASLEATLPIGLSFAGISLPTLHLALRTDDGAVSTEVSASIHAAIGPVKALIEKVGLRGALSFPERGGNLGGANLDLGFKPPSGVALSVDVAGIVSGGGALRFEPAQGLYFGAMQLTIQDLLTVKAFGLIATRLPDGRPGYSVIIFITAEDFQPIQLGLGFTLLGIGGMVGINRTFDVEVLRQGLKSGTLATLMFPRDPVGNATALINTLSTAFPARHGSYLLGLLVKIGWFTPTLIAFDLALILEFGARKRLLSLGRISALLPSPDNALIQLNMESLGVIDFDAGSVALDAVLVDSRLAKKFVMTGAAALRAGFGSGPDSSFVLAVGGMNPHFVPPAGLPVLNRVGIALSAGSNPRLICESYFAITSNTVQFGARASLFAKAGDFSVDGAVGFDVLVSLAPVHFIAEFHSHLRLNWGSQTLFMVEIDGQLEGPRPLRLSGRASFKIWFVHFSVPFDATLIRGEPPQPPPAIDVEVELARALQLPSSWSVERPSSLAHGVALRSLTNAAAGQTLVIDPLGTLTVKQQVVPLNSARPIDLYSNAPVKGKRRFTLTASTPEAGDLPKQDIKGAFAPAQYFNLSDDEKLVAPSFESMDAGCTFSAAGVTLGTALDAAPGVTATVLIRPSGSALAAASVVASTSLAAPSQSAAVGITSFSSERIASAINTGAAARAPVRTVGRVRFRNAAAPTVAAFKPKRWSIRPRGDGEAAVMQPSVRTWSEYHAELTRMNRGGARWQLLPAHETEG